MLEFDDFFFPLLTINTNTHKVKNMTGMAQGVSQEMKLFCILHVVVVSVFKWVKVVSRTAYEKLPCTIFLIW